MSELVYGIVSALDDATCRVRVRLPERDNIETYWLHVPQKNTLDVQRRALLPALGEQVSVLLEPDGAGGTVQGGIYSAANPPPITDADTEYVRFRDGTTVTYNQSAHALTFNGSASITIIANQVTVQAQTVTLDTPHTTCTGDVSIEGNLAVTGNSITHHGTDIGDTHVHTKVTPGLGNTSVPA